MEDQKTAPIDFSAIPRTAVKVITRPAVFFREMPKTGWIVEPLIFMVVIGVVSGIIQAALSLFHLSAVGSAIAGITAIVMMPVVVLIFGFIVAGIAFLIWKILGSKETYETAYRCCAYASAILPVTTVLGIIPYIGAIIGILIATFYIVMASVEVHGIPAKKAWRVFGIIAIILALMSVVSQFTAPKMTDSASRYQELEEAAREMQKSAEEARKAAEEMGKAAQKQSEEAQKEMQRRAEEMQKASDAMQKQLEDLKKQQKR